MTTLPLAPGATAERTCRGCGCTDARGCLPICWWVADDLCSACQPVTPGLSDWLLFSGCACGHPVAEHDEEGCGGRVMLCGCERPIDAVLELAVMCWIQARFRDETVRQGVVYAVMDANTDAGALAMTGATSDGLRDDVDVALRQLLLELFRPGA